MASYAQSRLKSEPIWLIAHIFCGGKRPALTKNVCSIMFGFLEDWIKSNSEEKSIWISTEDA